MKKFTALFILFIFTLSAIAQGDIISAKDFMAKKKADKSLVIIDANTASNYGKSHIQNAINVPHKELYQEAEIEGLIKSPEDLAAYFGKKGISNTATIIIYDDGSSKYNSRVYWVLKYLGTKEVYLLHKDMDQFKAARVPLTRAKTVSKATTFTPNVDKSVMATLADVKSGNAIVVDARDAEEYAGTAEKSDGHIAKAIHINYKEFVDDKGAFKSKADIEAVAAKHGLSKDKEIIMYCQTSVRAATSYVALRSIAGWPNVKVYDGAYNEWVAQGGALEQ